MITHYITPYKPPVYRSRLKKDKYQGKYGTPEHREWILERAVLNCKFTEGEFVRYKNEMAVIEDILTQAKDVEWDGMSPHFITIRFRGESTYVHPTRLQRYKK